MKYFLSFFLGLYLSGTLQAQITLQDTIVLSPVVLSKEKKAPATLSKAAASSVEELMSTHKDIQFVRRGAYGLEPLLNNLRPSQASITIEGMQVFSACTDHMDPLSSYVELNNLEEVSVSLGQSHHRSAGSIAGNIDLRTKAHHFSPTPQLKAHAQWGFEANNHHHFKLADAAMSAPKYSLRGSFSHRKAANYSAGKGVEVTYSQFEKYNSSVGFAHKVGSYSSWSADAIFDVGKNIGYPAMTMDAALARALITWLSFKHHFAASPVLEGFQGKLYANFLEHYMDDTTRPNTRVHMDMPGWSSTYGLWSKLSLAHSKWSGAVVLHAYSNTATAEMTMYAQEAGSKPMFAYSWPVVSTHFGNLHSACTWEATQRLSVQMSAGISMQHSSAKYMNFVRIFNPDAPASTLRLLPSCSAGATLHLGKRELHTAVGYGKRSPNTSEAYGYYIYNSADTYDYIGNPALESETALDVLLQYQQELTPALSIEAKSSYYYIRHYIVGKIHPVGSPMNPLSTGVKRYTTLPYAHLANMQVGYTARISSVLSNKASLRYAYSADSQSSPLPFVQPLGYDFSLHYTQKQLALQLSLLGNAPHSKHSAAYGERYTSGYAIANLSGQYSWHTKRFALSLSAGCENLLDRHYTTYADWGGIARMGRNMHIGLKASF